MRLRPLEVLRDGFDDALSRVKKSEFEAVWVDLAPARQFASVERMPQVCQRLSTLFTWC